MASPLFGEFMGTAVLILLGNGVVANVLLKKSKGEGGGWIVISAGWAFAVLFGVLTAMACGSHDANLNPAVTLGFAIVSGDFAKLLPFAIAQMLGAMTGATLVWLHYLPHWQATDDASLKLACYSTGPAIRNFAANAMSEIIGTFILVFVVGAIFSKAVSSTGFPPGYGPYLVGCLVWGSASHLADRLGMRSILRVIWARVSRTHCCRLRAKALPIGAMLWSRSRGRSSGQRWRESPFG